jgi:hypothetical protein
MMQRAESRIIYRVMAPRLIEQGIRFVTVHDSFMVLPGQAELTRSIIAESFESIGLPAPALSVS